MIALSSTRLLPLPQGEGEGRADAALRARCRRVAWLALAIAMMGLADLLCTLTYVTTSGMLEVNPLARLMLAIGEVRQLVLFKLLTIMLSCGMLYLARRHRQSEVCAWVGCALLLALMLHWVNFNRSVSMYTNDMAVLALSGGEFEPQWVKVEWK